MKSKNKSVKITKNHESFMQINEKVIIEDLKMLLTNNILPVHINFKKRSQISFIKDIPKMQKRRRNKPTLSNLYCPFCLKLLSGANGSVKNNRHFITVHKKISPRIQIDLLKFIKDDGLNFYRCIQLLSMYDKSLDSSFRKEKLKCLDDNCINQTENGCTIFVPKMDIKYPDSEEKKEMISFYSLETKTVDWLKVSFQVEKEKAITTNTESEIELVTTNSHQQSNNIQEIVNEKYLIKKQLFEQM